MAGKRGSVLLVQLTSAYLAMAAQGSSHPEDAVHILASLSELVLGEDMLRWDVERNSNSASTSSRGTMTRTTKNQQQQHHHRFEYGNEEKEDYDHENEEEEGDDDYDGETFESVELLHASSRERVAYTALYLLQELQSSSEEVSAIAMMGSSSAATTAAATTAEDAVTNNEQQLQLPSLKDENNLSSSANGVNSAIIEKSKYLMKLSSRIRRLESDAVKCLVGRLEGALIAMRNLSEEGDGGAEKEEDDEGTFLK